MSKINMKERYHYTECGLDYIYLNSGFERITSKKGNGIIIKDIDGLHKVIGLCLVDRKKNLDGKELRFLRQEMLMSQDTLARLLEVGEQTIRRWENGKSEVSKPAEALIRMLYREHVGEDSQIRTSLKRIADLEDEIDKTKREGFVLQKTSAEWKMAA